MLNFNKVYVKFAPLHLRDFRKCFLVCPVVTNLATCNKRDIFRYNM